MVLWCAAVVLVFVFVFLFAMPVAFVFVFVILFAMPVAFVFVFAVHFAVPGGRWLSSSSSSFYFFAKDPSLLLTTENAARLNVRNHAAKHRTSCAREHQRAGLHLAACAAEARGCLAQKGATKPLPGESGGASPPPPPSLSPSTKI